MANLDERGQIMLIAAFVLAISFIAVAVLLNSVIYTENLATRGEDARGSEAITYRGDIVKGTERLIEYANENNTDYENTTTGFSEIQSDFNESVTAMRNASALLQAIDGHRTNISIVTVTEGRRIGQFNGSRNFTDVNGNPDWKLAEDVNGTRAFEINITNGNQLDDGSGDPFTVRLNGTSNDWSVEIYNDTSTEEITIDVGGTTCEIGGKNPEIDLTAGTIDGEECPSYTFASNVSPKYEIEFENSQNIQGNFSLVVNSTSVDASNYDNNSDSPFADEAIFQATIHIVHESADHIFETDARVIPGESDV